MVFREYMTRHPMFDSMVLNTDYRIVGDLTVTDMIMTNSFWIGLYPGMGNEAIQYMIDKIREFVKAK